MSMVVECYRVANVPVKMCSERVIGGQLELSIRMQNFLLYHFDRIIERLKPKMVVNII